MKKLITPFVVLFSINVIAQISFTNYRSEVEKISIRHTTYKEAISILGKPDKVTSTDKKILKGVPGVTNDIEIEAEVLYEYINKGITLLCRDKKKSSVIEQIDLEGTFKDTIQNALFVGMREQEALKICDSLYQLKEKFLNSTSQYSDNTNIYFFIGNRYDISIDVVNNKIVHIGLFKFETNIEKYGDKWGKLVDEGKIQLGMTKEMVEDSWGKPDDINRSVGSWGVHEQWIYSSGTYLYFENSKLTSWQD